jgi:galactokinase
VLCAAIDRRIVCLADQAGPPEAVEAVFADVEPVTSVQIALEATRDWRNPGRDQSPADYLSGTVAAALTRGASIPFGLRIAVAGDVPLGLGLSSSAALCVALALLADRPAPQGRDLVLRAQEAEHRAGTPCGTMDQSASVAGRVILFDGATLAFERLEPDLERFAFAVLDSGVSRSLAHSSYGRRVAESAAAAAAATRILGREVAALAEITPAELPRLERGGLDGTAMKRVRHIVTEVDRVKRGVAAVQAADWPTFGVLMRDSGHSSAIDYEISHPRVEEIVAESLTVDGVLGARMMGGGEGGAALVLVRRDAIGALRERLDSGYFRSWNLLDRSDRMVVCAIGEAAEAGRLRAQ